MSRPADAQTIDRLRLRVQALQAQVDLLVENTPYQKRWGLSPEEILNKTVRALDAARRDLFEAETGRKADR